MSGTLPNPVGPGRRRQLMAQALGGTGASLAAMPTGLGAMPTPPVPPARRRSLMAQALQSTTAPPPEPQFQPISSMGGAAAPGAGDAALGDAAPGAEDRISTSVPTAAGSEETVAPHTRSDLEIGIDKARAAPEAWKKNADLIRTYPQLDTKGLNDDQVHEKFIDHLTGNLVWLHNQIDPAIRDSSKRWYDGARTIAERWAQKYDLHPRQVAGVLAALSPQKDWFQNVSLAERLLDMHKQSQIDAAAGGGNRAAAPGSGVLASSEAIRGKLQGFVDATKRDAERAIMQQHVDEMAGKSLHEISDPFQRAMWMRANDAANNAPTYRVVTPEGEFGDFAKTKSGKADQKIAWGSFKEVHKAMQALADPSLENISRNMGGNHKVRNFYNNIIAPRFGRDVTIDTHAIAAANLIPAGSTHELVGAGLGLKGSSSNATGARGLYAHYAEAHRRAAEQLGLLPRELQSITWEGVRGLFTPEQKRDKGFVAANKDLWRRYAQGELDANATRDAVLRHAAPQGIRDPGYLRRGVEDDA